MNFVVTKNFNMPPNRGSYVSHAEIARIVKKVFPDKTESIERSQFTQLYIQS